MTWGHMVRHARVVAQARKTLGTLENNPDHPQAAGLEVHPPRPFSFDGRLAVQ